jgi:hypothetical protein
MLRATRFVCTLAALALLLRVGFAHGLEQAPHQRVEEGDLKLESGEIIKDSISYVTQQDHHGIPGRVAKNCKKLQ